MVPIGAECCEEGGCCGRCVVSGRWIVGGAEVRAAKDDCGLLFDGRCLGAHVDEVARWSRVTGQGECVHGLLKPQSLSGRREWFKAGAKSDDVYSCSPYI